MIFFYTRFNFLRVLISNSGFDILVPRFSALTPLWCQEVTTQTRYHATSHKQIKTLFHHKSSVLIEAKWRGLIFRIHRMVLVNISIQNEQKHLRWRGVREKNSFLREYSTKKLVSGIVLLSRYHIGHRSWPLRWAFPNH